MRFPCNSNNDFGTRYDFVAVRNPRSTFWLAWILDLPSRESINIIYFQLSGSLQSGYYVIHSWKVETITQSHLIVAGLEVQYIGEYFRLLTPISVIQQAESNAVVSKANTSVIEEDLGSLVTTNKRMYWDTERPHHFKYVQARCYLDIMNAQTK